VYKIEYHKKVIKEINLIKESNLDRKLKKLIEILKENPFQNPPPYEKLIGELNGLYSRRINIQHRLIYMVDDENKRIRILSVWSHYEKI